VVKTTTGAAGYAYFQMGDAHSFNAPSQAHWVVAVLDGDSDVYNSVGWVARVTPCRWLNPKFICTESAPPTPEPEPTPEPVDFSEAIATLESSISQAQAVLDWLKAQP
jgi:hypothetical protein